MNKNERKDNSKKRVAIVYMVAGMSARFGGKIKQFAKVGKNGETLIELSLKQSTSVGFDKIVFVVGKMTEAPFREMFGDNYNGVPVSYVKQTFNPENREKPWGTTDAICCARKVLDCDFVVCNGDDIYGENTFRILYNHLQKHEDPATIGYKLIDVVPDRGAVNRGIFEVDGEYVSKITETFNIFKSEMGSRGLKDDSPCSQNIFALQPRVLEILNDILINFKKNHDGDRKAECLLPSNISDLISSKKIKMRMYLTPDKWIGVTNPEDELIVREFLDNNS